MRLFRIDYSNQADEQLMLLFQKGDKKAFEHIYNRYANHLVNFFYQKLWQNQLKAEDAAQDIFTKLIVNPQLFDAKQNFKTWVFSVAYNRCKNEYKKQEVRRNTNYDVPEYHQNASDNILSDEHLDQSEFAAALRKTLNGMAEKHALVFKLRHDDNLSMKEIAEILQINEGTVKSRLHYATKYLASELSVYRKIIEK
ncbi:MAG: RNA polymerase sigma factor [Putridiphycobacter sp.]|nr:RNA polymerase sigma factor [Putridiphycobacter sp.]